MLGFVYDNINVRERRVHLTKASPFYVVYRTCAVFWQRFEVIVYKQVSRCFKTTGSDHSVCTICSLIVGCTTQFKVGTTQQSSCTGLLCVQVQWTEYQSQYGKHTCSHFNCNSMQSTTTLHSNSLVIEDRYIQTNWSATVETVR